MKGKGGYCMIDAGGLIVGVTTAQTIAGLNEKLHIAFNAQKPVLLYNFRFTAARTSSPSFVSVHLGDAGRIFAKLDNIQIEVSSADRVTCTNLIPG